MTPVSQLIGSTILTAGGIGVLAGAHDLALNLLTILAISSGVIIMGSFTGTRIALFFLSRS